MPETSPELKKLETKAKEQVNTLKEKYRSNGTPKAIEDAANYAYAVWHKAAQENPNTGAAQLDLRSGVSSLERYFLAKLPKK